MNYEPRIHPYHFHLWAKQCRQTVDVGYPHVNVLHTPAKLGDVWDDRAIKLASAIKSDPPAIKLPPPVPAGFRA